MRRLRKVGFVLTYFPFVCLPTTAEYKYIFKTAVRRRVISERRSRRNRDYHQRLGPPPEGVKNFLDEVGPDPAVELSDQSCCNDHYGSPEPFAYQPADELEKQQIKDVIEHQPSVNQPSPTSSDDEAPLDHKAVY